jgi:hypothetical protein
MVKKAEPEGQALFDLKGVESTLNVEWNGGKMEHCE